MSRVEYRRSPRIFELDARRAQQIKCQNNSNKICETSAKQESGKSKEPVLCYKRGRKKTKVRPVQDLVTNVYVNQANMVGTQDANMNHHDTATIPYKHVLEEILEILQKKDEYKIFAEPVNANEVAYYYDVIKEPMDFGTLSKRLNQNTYKSLEEFEYDVSLVYRNAMHFNASNTKYYKQARAIKELATRLFNRFKTDPENFEATFSRKRVVFGRKGKDKVGAFKPSVNTKPASQVVTTEKGHEKERKTKTSEADRRSTYQPLASFPIEDVSLTFATLDCPNILQLNEDADIDYVGSLSSFSKDFGPTAQLVARRKIEKYIATKKYAKKKIFVAPSVEVPPKFSAGSMSTISNEKLGAPTRPNFHPLSHDWINQPAVTCAESFGDLAPKIPQPITEDSTSFQLFGNLIGRQVFSGDGKPTNQFIAKGKMVQPVCEPMGLNQPIKQVGNSSIEKKIKVKKAWNGGPWDLNDSPVAENGNPSSSMVNTMHTCRFPDLNLGEGTSAAAFPYERTGLLQDAILQPTCSSSVSRNNSWGSWPASMNQTMAQSNNYLNNGKQVVGTRCSSFGVPEWHSQTTNTIDFFQQQQQPQPVQTLVQPKRLVNFLYNDDSMKPEWQVSPHEKMGSKGSFNLHCFMGAKATAANDRSKMPIIY